jgi:hypothetical protein
MQREEAEAKREQSEAMNDLIRGAYAELKSARQHAGPPSKEVVVAVRENLRSEGKNAGYKSVAAALRARGWEISERTVQRRLTE